MLGVFDSCGALIGAPQDALRHVIRKAYRAGARSAIRGAKLLRFAIDTARCLVALLRDTATSVLLNITIDAASFPSSCDRFS